MPAIFLGQSPERDRNIDDICQQIRNFAKAGMFQAKYNFTILGIPRSGTAKGRGPSRYSEFVLANDKNKDTPTIAGKVDADTLLGAHHLLPRAGRSRGRGIQGEAWAATRRIPACRRATAASTRCSASPDGLEEVPVDQGEPVSRPEFLPGHRVRAAREAGRADLRRDPLLRIAQEDLQRALQEHRRRLPELPRDRSSTTAASTC